MFEKSGENIEQAKNNLKNVLEEGLTSEFKGTVIRAVNNLSYFEYLDLTNNKVCNTKPNQIEYPKEVIEIAVQA